MNPYLNFSLEGKVALVTGEIGRASCRERV